MTISVYTLFPHFFGPTKIADNKTGNSSNKTFKHSHQESLHFSITYIWLWAVLELQTRLCHEIFINQSCGTLMETIFVSNGYILCFKNLEQVKEQFMVWQNKLTEIQIWIKHGCTNLPCKCHGWKRSSKDKIWHVNSG